MLRRGKVRVLSGKCVPSGGESVFVCVCSDGKVCVLRGKCVRSDGKVCECVCVCVCVLKAKCVF